MTDTTMPHDPDRQLEDRLRNLRHQVDYPAVPDTVTLARARIEAAGSIRSSQRQASEGLLAGWDDDADEPVSQGTLVAFPDKTASGSVRRLLQVIAAAMAILIVGGALVVLIPNIAGDGQPTAGVLGPETTGYRLAGTLGGSVVPNEPVSVALDADGNIYAPDIATRSVHRFTPSGEHIASFAAEDSEIGSFIRPWDIAIQGDRLYVLDQRRFAVYVLSLDGEVQDAWLVGDPEDAGNLLAGLTVDEQHNIYVARANEGIVSIYSEGGRHLRDVVVSTDPQSGGGRPADVAVGTDGRVYVTTFGGDVVRVFSPDGSPLEDWSDITLPSHFSSGLLAVTTGNDGEIYVNSESGVATLDPSGSVLNVVSIDVPDPTARVVSPGSVGIGADGTIYLPVPDDQKIVGLTPDGEVVVTIQDDRDNRFAFPGGMHIDAGGTILVSDSLRKQVAALESDGSVTEVIPWEIDRFEPPLPVPTGDVTVVDEHLYILDGASRTVVKAMPDGNKVLEFTGALISDDYWSRPMSLHGDGRGSIYVMDTDVPAIYQYDTEGAFQQVFGRWGLQPMAMAIRNEVVYVAYAGGDEPGIWTLDLDGNPMERVVAFEQDDQGNIDRLIWSIAIADTGDIFTLDPSARTIHWHGPDGSLRDTWPVDTGYEQARTLMYLAVDDTGRLYVSDGDTRQILVYEPVS